MPRDLFGAVTDPPAHIGTRSRLTLPLSLAAHALALIVLVVVPLVATDVLPIPDDVIGVVLDHPILPPDPPRPIPPQARATAPPVNPDAAPLVAPNDITPEPPPRPPTDVGTAQDSTSLGTVIGTADAGRFAEPTPPPAPPPTATVQVGGAITAPTKIHDVAPVYPPTARAARIQGVVIIQATIGVDGSVVGAEVLRPLVFLDQAALDAVRQWRFTPTQLNGLPVAVIMTVTVHFRLD